MPTTTKGTWTPADNDDWDLTIDLAAMANSIDLWTTGRYEKSGASVAALGTGAYVGQLGYVTSPAPGRAMRWNGSAWVNTPGSGAFSGTAGQRAAYLSTASEGNIWHDTDGSKLIYSKIGSAWAQVGDNRKVEEMTLTATLAGTETAVAPVYFRNFSRVTFLTPFPSPPNLLVTTVTPSSAVQVNEVVAADATGFDMRGIRFQAAGVTAPVIHYRAVLL